MLLIIKRLCKISCFKGDIVVFLSLGVFGRRENDRFFA